MRGSATSKTESLKFGPFTSSRKPKSRRRSASSSTRISTASSETVGALRSRSISRPGVATTTSGDERSSASCTDEARPPTTRQNRTSVKRPSARPIESHWAASSRVGARTSTRVAGTRRGRWSSRSSAGSMKAAVLPEPVCAEAHRSPPQRAAGITRDWMGVGFLKPSSARPLSSGIDSRISAKVATSPSSADAAPRSFF